MLRFKQLNDTTVSFSVGGKNFYHEKLSSTDIALIYKYIKLAKNNINYNPLGAIERILEKYEVANPKNYKDKKIQKGLKRAYVVKGDKCFLKGFNIEVPKCFFTKTLELSENYVNFLKLLSLNPIQAIREKLPKYVVDNNLRITDNGYIVACRQVFKVDAPEHSLTDLIKSLYFKIKTKWKKSPKHFWIDPKTAEIVAEDDENAVNLHDTYIALEAIKSDVFYTSAHTRLERWQVGDFMELEERNIYNTEQACGSKMLHVRSNPKALCGYGDTNILLLVNPQDVISCVEAWKFGVCRCYFAAIMQEDDLSLFDAPLQNFEHDFMEKEWREIEPLLDTTSPQYVATAVNYKKEPVQIQDYARIIRERTYMLKTSQN